MKGFLIGLVITTTTFAGVFTMKTSLQGLDQATKSAECVLKNEKFHAEILATKFDQTTKTPTQIVTDLKSGKPAFLRHYRTINPKSSATAHTVKDEIYFNKWNFSGKPLIVMNTTIHEYMHVLGYSHKGNRPKGLENTVPYKVGNMSEKYYEICK